MTTDLVLDTSVFVKGFVPPKRKKRDEVYYSRLALHRKAKSILDEVTMGRILLHEPVAMLVETASVVSRLSNNPALSRLAVSFITEHSLLYSDVYLLEIAIDLGITTKASGFDVLFLACAKRAGAKLITDDKKMYEKAVKAGIEAELLRGTTSSP
ncbi:type II toxin-antitoxin system VapC family toxin [Thermococcus camini]|uniref:Predicted nucleic acid-binding protein, contains PIN domain n=1 Tax=Thermococcus camini TaxID=2016373 RepID=A0A7G2D8B1_9EURY|nr:type II toxin-antitoxin system VapC family toxin [Thermococcus camini]CAD5244244.1 Predicted nucleic acid-binding protein, contains PIN domain [Thermococcus camini]